MFHEGDDLVKEDLLKSVLWNSLIINEEIASAKYKLPFSIIAEASKTDDFETWRRR